MKKVVSLLSSALIVSSLLMGSAAAAPISSQQGGEQIQPHYLGKKYVTMKAKTVIQLDNMNGDLTFGVNTLDPMYWIVAVSIDGSVAAHVPGKVSVFSYDVNNAVAWEYIITVLP